MARGGYRPGAGRPRGTGKANGGAPSATASSDGSEGETRSPLEYMLSVMSDPRAEKSRRDRMAIAAAPFVHSRAAEADTGKTAKRAARAKEIGVGRFATPAAPKLVVNNG